MTDCLSTLKHSIRVFHTIIFFFRSKFWSYYQNSDNESSSEYTLGRFFVFYLLWLHHSSLISSFILFTLTSSFPLIMEYLLLETMTHVKNISKKKPNVKRLLARSLIWMNQYLRKPYVFSAQKEWLMNVIKC